MAKPVGPLMAFDARGQIGKAMVYGSWRGRAYVRRYVKPANPKAAAQTETRNAFKWLQAVWKAAPALFHAPWTLYAQGQVFTDRNAFTSKNVGALRAQTALTALTMSPGAKGGLAVSSVTLTPGGTQIAAACAVPAAPLSWTLVGVIWYVIRDQNPQVATLYTITAAENDVGPYGHTFTGLINGDLYWVGAVLKWTKPDGTTAYGPAVMGSATPA